MGDNVNMSKKYDWSLWTGFIWLSRGAAFLSFPISGYVVWKVDTKILRD